MTGCMGNESMADTRVLRDAPLILVVEDDGRTLDFILTLLKYAISAQVLSARNPSSALSAAGAAGRSIDLLISDIDLAAGKTGIDLARELARNNPSMKVVLMSARDVPRRDLHAEWRFLAKPFMVTTLLDYVGELGFPVSGCFQSHGNSKNRLRALGHMQTIESQTT